MPLAFRTDAPFIHWRPRLASACVFTCPCEVEPNADACASVSSLGMTTTAGQCHGSSSPRRRGPIGSKDCVPHRAALNVMTDAPRRRRPRRRRRWPDRTVRPTGSSSPQRDWSSGVRPRLPADPSPLDAGVEAHAALTAAACSPAVATWAGSISRGPVASVGRRVASTVAAATAAAPVAMAGMIPSTYACGEA